jgi:hypothetical protein
VGASATADAGMAGAVVSSCIAIACGIVCSRVRLTSRPPDIAPDIAKANAGPVALRLRRGGAAWHAAENAWLVLPTRRSMPGHLGR